MAIVLPDSILGAPSLEYVREWIFRNTRIVSSVDLHKDTFEPGNGTKTSVLVLQKLETSEQLKRIRAGKIEDYSIFMAVVDRIGHDKRGNTVYKRDALGNEIMVPEDNSVIELSRLSDGSAAKRAAPKRKVIDDQTLPVADAFLAWKKREVLGW